MSAITNINKAKKDFTPVNLKTTFPQCGFKNDVIIEIPNVFPEHLLVPSYDPTYEPDVNALTQAVMWIAKPYQRSQWCFGYPGTGKTELWHYICHHLRLPLIVISATADTRTDKLQGKFVLKNNGDGVETKFELGAVAEAMKAGVPCLLDEGDKLNSDTAASLHRVAEMKPWLVEDTKEVIIPGDWFRLIVCANTNGRESNPAFPSSRIQDQAFLDRFDFLSFDYLEPSAEAEILRQEHPSLDVACLGFMVQVANVLREATFGPKKGKRRDITSAQGINAKMTLRTLKAWGYHLRNKGYQGTFEDALEPCFLAGLDSMTYNALMAENGILKKVTGKRLNMSPLELMGKS
mgnify:CR=1 FL=1